MTRRAWGVACMLAGAALLTGAALLLGENRREESQAGEQSAQALSSLRQEIRAEELRWALPEEAWDEAAAQAVRPMPTIEIDGQEYIGYLELPTLGLELPVMSEWSYPKLRIAPCRYWGSVYDNSLVILAHNYDRHFGRLQELQRGDPVRFIDADGVVYEYTVEGQEILERTDVEDMLDGEADLTLFTCTYGGRQRVTIRLSAGSAVPTAN